MELRKNIMGIKESTVLEFPEKISSTKIEKLLSHLGEDLTSEINYTLMSAYRRGYPVIGGNLLKKREQHHARCEVTIRFRHHRQLNFSMVGYNEKGNNFFYKELVFYTQPGISMRGRRKMSRQHPDDMESVKRSLERYFS